MFTSKPYSPSCDENKEVILKAIHPLLKNTHRLLEIASGTGQHALYFAKHLPHLSWQPSDLTENLTGIQQWLDEDTTTNVLPPMPLDVSKNSWPSTTYDAIFSANSFHIMGKQQVEDFFSHLTSVLNPNASIIIYGPFNYHGQYTSDSNARFDQWLKARNPDSGIKAFEWCNDLAKQAGLSLTHDITMPQNNRILVWKRDSGNESSEARISLKQQGFNTA